MILVKYAVGRLSDYNNLSVTGENKPECEHCLDNPKSRCKHCSCSVCGEKGEPEKQLMCDECDSAYHIYCLKPPLEAIPDVEEWLVFNVFVLPSSVEYAFELF